FNTEGQIVINNVIVMGNGPKSYHNEGYITNNENNSILILRNDYIPFNMILNSDNSINLVYDEYDEYELTDTGLILSPDGTISINELIDHKNELPFLTRRDCPNDKCNIISREISFN